nr:SdpI family protein [uncultured Mediterraneibacter sp.]
MKNYKKMGLLTIVVTLLPILLGLLLWSKLPDQVPMHWGINGEVDGWESKARAVFFMPCFCAAMQLFLLVMTSIDPRKKAIHRKPMMVVIWLIPVLSLVMNVAIYLIALGFKVNMVEIILVLLGAFFVLLGNYMPKLKKNYTVGIKVPWALNSEENWIRTHRFGGKVYVVTGIVCIIIGLLVNLIGENVAFVIIMVLIFGGSFLTMGYSYWLYKYKHI